MQTGFPFTSFPWEETAAPVPPAEPLQDAVSTDILIIGGGYAGLSTALHLAQLGYKPVVLEARELGYGASGRNGGQLVPGLKWDPNVIAKRFGVERAEKLIHFAGQTATEVFRLIDAHGLDVATSRNGWLQPAHSAKGMRLAQRRYQQWGSRGADVALLDARAMAALLGTGRYHGGWLDRRGGGVQPLSYVRELGRAALRAGAVIHTHSPVDHLQRTSDAWLATTACRATVQAKVVILCTNAYGNGLVPGLQRSILDVNTYQIATEPLPAAVADNILPQGHVASDTKNLLLYFRKDPMNRFVMGGRGPMREPRALQDWKHLKHASLALFPALRGVAWQHHWCGRVAMTRDYFPHLHEPAENLLVTIGCMGRGIGLQTSMGKAIAHYVHTRNADALPVALSAIKPLPLYAFRKIYVNAIVAWYRMTDGGTKA